MNHMKAYQTFYPRLQDKIWEWLGSEAAMIGSADYDALLTCMYNMHTTHTGFGLCSLICFMTSFC